MKKISMILGIALALLPLNALAQAAESVSLKQRVNGYAGVENMSIVKGQRFHERTYAGMLVGGKEAEERRALLRFDLSVFAGRKVVGDASLVLRQANTSSKQVGTYRIEVYQIYGANHGWRKGKPGQFAEVGQSAWAFKNKGATGERSTPWAGSAGLGTAGVDYNASAIATIVYNTDNDKEFITVTIPAGLVQMWIDNPQGNAGLLFARAAADSSSEILGSYNGGTGASGPELKFNVSAAKE